MNAYEWGLAHGSCVEALEWRRSLGPNATQSDAWRLCEQGDWLLWQWSKLPAGRREATRPAIRRAVDWIVTRAIQRGQQVLCGVREPWAMEWLQWARGWLAGKDRSTTAAATAAARVPATARVPEVSAAARAAAWARVRARVQVMEVGAAKVVCEAACEAAAEAAEERRAQACDIHREIPEWPGET